MKCWLCNTEELHEFVLDARDNKLKPCHVCESVIMEAVMELEAKDKKKADVKLETEIVDEDILLEDEWDDEYETQYYINQQSFNTFGDE